MSGSSAITAIEYELGSETLSFEEIQERFGPEHANKVFSGTGIRERRIAPPGVCGSDLAYAAADRLLKANQIDPGTIDFIIHCTQSPDYLMPTTACLLQRRLGFSNSCGAFDINLGCSQYVYGLSVAHSLVKSGVARRVLLTTGDTMSHYIHPKDRAIVPLMGDAGSATLIEPVETPGFLGFELGTDGSGAEYIMIPAGGARERCGPESRIEVTDSEGGTRSRENMYMNGAAVFLFAASTVPRLVQSLLKKLDLSMDQVDCILFHQTNKYMLDHLAKKLKIPAEKTHTSLETTGNTSGSALPGVLTSAIQAGKVKPNSLVVLVAFGVGLSWAACALRWAGEGNPL